jgi:hypothetical protein
MSDMVGGNLISGVTPGFEFENGNVSPKKASRRGRVCREKALRHNRPRAGERTLRADDASK